MVSEKRSMLNNREEHKNKNLRFEVSKMLWTTIQDSRTDYPVNKQFSIPTTRLQLHTVNYRIFIWFYLCKPILLVTAVEVVPEFVTSHTRQRVHNNAPKFKFYAK